MVRSKKTRKPTLICRKCKKKGYGKLCRKCYLEGERRTVTRWIANKQRRMEGKIVIKERDPITGQESHINSFNKKHLTEQEMDDIFNDWAKED